MKLPSIQYLSSQAFKSFVRFPLSILTSLISVIIAVYAFEFKKEITDDLFYVNLTLIMALGIPAFFCTKVLIEKKSYNLIYQTLAYLIPTILLLLIYWSLPTSEQSNNSSVPYIRYAIYNVIAHLLVSFTPYWRKGNLNAFWNYNKILFIRFLTALLYSSFLYAGLSLALTALDLLFDIDLHYELFMDLFIVIFGFFNTWFFVAGIPSNFEALETDINYPKGLKVFSQYILLPLLALYLIILYSYGAKIVIQWNLPKGIVSYLISGVSILGIFNFLLFYPYGKQKGNEWIDKFNRVYYWLLIPLIALLFVAISIRLNDYGFTIKRYLVFLLGIWLSINVLYFILKRKNIKFIPISLTVILAIMSFGPWSMFSWSERSQSDRLINILENNGIIKDGKVQNEVIWNVDSLPDFHIDSAYSDNKLINDHLLTDSLFKEVRSIIDYLGDYHTFIILYPYFQQNIDSLIHTVRDSGESVYEKSVYMNSLGLMGNYRWNDKDYNSFEQIYFNTKPNNIKNIEGYNYFTTVNLRSNQNRVSVQLNNKEIFVSTPKVNQDLITFNYQSKSISIDLSQLKEDLIVKYKENHDQLLSAKKITFKKESDDLKIKLIIQNLNIKYKNDSSYFNYINGELYIKLKEQE